MPLDIFHKNIEIAIELTPEEYSKNLLNTLQKSYENVIANTSSKVEKMKFYHDRNVRATSYDVNDLVWLRNDKDGSKKLNKKWIGPFKIIQKINELNYAIKNTNKRSRKLIVHINRLKKCHMRTTEVSKNNIPKIKIEADKVIQENIVETENNERIVMPMEKEREKLKEVTENEVREVNVNLTKRSEADSNHEVIENEGTKRKGRRKGSKNEKKKKPLPPELIQENSIVHRLRSHKK